MFFSLISVKMDFAFGAGVEQMTNSVVVEVDREAMVTKNMTACDRKCWNSRKLVADLTFE